MAARNVPFDFSVMEGIECSAVSPWECFPPPTPIGRQKPPYSGSWMDEEWMDYLWKTLEDVSEGRITTDEANQRILGPDPLIIEPYLFDLDDPRLLRWSPEMAAAWMHWKTPIAVLRHFYASYEHATVWVPTNREYSEKGNISRCKMPGRSSSSWRSGYKIEHLRRTHVNFEFRDFDGDLKSFYMKEDLFPKLFGLLSESIIKARGLPLYENASKINIPAPCWEEAGFGYHREYGTVLEVKGTPTYSNITFSASDIMKHFPVLVNVEEVYPWKPEAERAFRRSWHEPVFNLLRAECPAGLPVLHGPQKIYASLIYEFLNPHHAELSTAIGNSPRNFEQNLTRYIGRLCYKTAQPMRGRFGRQMTEAINKVLK